MLETVLDTKVTTTKETLPLSEGAYSLAVNEMCGIKVDRIRRVKGEDTKINIYKGNGEWQVQQVQSK